MDSYFMYIKWQSGQIDNELLYGIIAKQGASGKASLSLDPAYLHRVSCHYRSEGLLTVGQWWLYQICSLRDGGHRSLYGSIYGQRGDGAYSILLGSRRYSSDHEFREVDDGNHFQYCGITGKEGAPSQSRKIFLEPSETGHEVRVFRSSKLPASTASSIYRRRKGFVVTLSIGPFPLNK